MGDDKSTNKASRATAYPAVGRAENSMSIIVSQERDIARRTFLVPCLHWVYGGPLLKIFKH
jgi:hypothetical protein